MPRLLDALASLLHFTSMGTEWSYFPSITEGSVEGWGSVLTRTSA